MQEKELLDFCRVKKIFDKGFGFLTSLYFEEPVFFHFNNVKDPLIKEKLEKMKRGEVYFFYTSAMHSGKRKVLKLWFDVKEIDKNLIPEFTDRIIQELNYGKINIFEIAHVIKQLRENNFIDKEKFRKILTSKKMLKTPTVLKAVLRNDEINLTNQIEFIIECFESKKITDIKWADKILDEIGK